MGDFDFVRLWFVRWTRLRAQVIGDGLQQAFRRNLHAQPCFSIRVEQRYLTDLFQVHAHGIIGQGEGVQTCAFHQRVAVQVFQVFIVEGELRGVIVRHGQRVVEVVEVIIQIVKFEIWSDVLRLFAIDFGELV